MSGTIRKIFAASVALAALALGSWHVASRYDAAPPPLPANALGAQFAADPGDGWALLGGFLMLVAVAVACAGAMMWVQESKD